MSAPARTPPSAALSGAQKCAVLCVALGPKGAASILQQLAPDEVERVSREIAALPSIGNDAVSAVLEEFQRTAQVTDAPARGGLSFARQLLEQTQGAQHAQATLERIQGTTAPDLGRLRKAAPDTLASLLRDEHPQTIALTLAHLPLEQAAAVVKVMAPDVASDVLFRMARMGQISPAMLAVVESVIGGKADVSLSQPLTASGGPGVVAKLLNQTEPEMERRLMASLTERNAELAGNVKALMFVFEDLIGVDNKGMQRVLREVDGKDLALALKAASDELKAHIRAAMSERAAAALDEEIEILGAVRLKDVEAVHAKIIESVRALEEAGEIMLKRGGAGGGDVVG